MPSNSKALTLSIIIPAHNEEHHLGKCLDSISSQSVKPDEVIVVDNNSTDNTVKVAKKYKFVRVLSEKRIGIVPARNKGFNSAKSEILGRLDADSCLPEDWVARVKDFYSQGNKDSCLTGGGYFYNVRARRFNGWMFSQVAYRMNRLIIGHDILWGSNTALPKALWKKVEKKVCHRKDIHEDMDLAIHLNRIGYRIIYIESLRVGAMMRRLYTNKDSLHEHMQRWPRTLKVHGYKLWWLGSVGNIILWTGRPVIFVGEFVSRYILRRDN